MKKILSNFRAGVLAGVRKAHMAIGERFALLAVKPHKRIYRPSYKVKWQEAEAVAMRGVARESAVLERAGELAIRLAATDSVIEGLTRDANASQEQRKIAEAQVVELRARADALEESLRAAACDLAHWAALYNNAGDQFRSAEKEPADMQENMAGAKTPEQIALGIQETLRLDGGHRCISGEHHDTAGTLPTEPTVPPTRSSLGGICSVHGIFTGYRCSRCDQEADDDG